MSSRRLHLGIIFVIALLGAGVCFLAYQNYDSVTPYPVIVHYFDTHKSAPDCDRSSKSYSQCMAKLTDHLGWELVNKYGPHLTHRQADFVVATCKDLPSKMPGRNCNNPLDFEAVIRAVGSRE